ncbi:MAG: RrF2 family transcriptional regulator [Coriobacteriia bacterium]
MRISQRLDYTLRMAVALGRLPFGTTAAAGELARALGLPRRFGEQQMTALAKIGIVSSRRGTSGGASLARPASEITVLDIVKAVQGESLDVPRSTASATAELWAEAAAVLDERLASTTLEDLVKRQAEIDADQSSMYFI